MSRSSLIPSNKLYPFYCMASLNPSCIVSTSFFPSSSSRVQIRRVQALWDQHNKKQIESRFALRGRKCALWKSSIPDSVNPRMYFYVLMIKQRELEGERTHIVWWIFESLTHCCIWWLPSVSHWQPSRTQSLALPRSLLTTKPSRTFFFLYKTRLRLHLTPHGPISNSSLRTRTAN